MVSAETVRPRLTCRVRASVWHRSSTCGITHMPGEVP